MRLKFLFYVVKIVFNTVALIPIVYLQKVRQKQHPNGPVLQLKYCFTETSCVNVLC